MGGDGSFYYIERPVFGDTGYVRKINLPDLQLEWQVPVPINESAGVLHLDHGILYVQTTTSQAEEPYLYLLDAINGDIIDRRQYHNDFFLQISPVSDDQYLLGIGGNYYSLVCFDRWTGQERWNRYGLTMNSPQGAPAMYRDKAYMCSEGFIQSFDLTDGHINWQVQLQEESISNLNTIIDTVHQQIIWSGDGYIYAIALDDGHINWKKPTSNSFENTMLSDNRIFHVAYNQISVYDAGTGDLIMAKSTSSSIRGEPVIAHQKIYLPLESGFEIWDSHTLSTLWSIPLSVKSISVMDQYLLLTDNVKEIHIYKSEGQCCNSTVEWVETTFFMSGSGFSTRYTFDSIPISHNDLTYFEVLQSATEHGNDWKPTDLLIREADQKIWKYRPEGEVVLCDFNLQVNDIFTEESGVELTVTDIDTITLVNGEYRKRLKLECVGFWPVYWIEGIGTTGGLIENFDCFFDIGTILLCHSQQGILLYQDANYNTCWLNIVSTKNLKADSISIFPNPALSEISIDIQNHQIQKVYAVDLLGSPAYMGNTSPFDITSLPPGYYFLRIEMENKQVVMRPFVKQ